MLETLELSDRPVDEGQIHAPRNVFPVAQFRAGQIQSRHQRLLHLLGQHGEQPQRAVEIPHCHEVGVGVVVQPRLVCIRVAVVVFVGTDHAANDIAASLRVQLGNAAPEARRLQDQLAPHACQQSGITGGKIQRPDIVGDCGADVPLQVGRIGNPVAGERIELKGWRFVLPATAAAPGKHGPTQAGLLCTRPRSVQSLVAVVQQLQRKPQIEIRLAGIGIRIAPGLLFDRGLEVRHAFPDLPIAQQVQAVGVVQPDIGGIAPQAFHIIIGGQEGGVAVLLQMLARQIQFFQGLNFFRLFQGLGGVGNGPVLPDVFFVHAEKLVLFAVYRHLVIPRRLHGIHERGPGGQIGGFIIKDVPA